MNTINLFDSLNPASFNQFKPRLGSYAAQALDAAEVMRGAFNYEPFIFALPEQGKQVLDARGTYDGRVKLLPGTMIFSLSASSSEAAGMKVQITDLGTGVTLFSKPVQHVNMSGGTGNASGITSPLFILPLPKLVIEPGLVSVSITNLAAVVNTVQVCLFVAQPAFWRPV